MNTIREAWEGENGAKTRLILAMFIYGTIGIFRRYIPLPSSVLALARSVIGTVFLALFLKVTGRSLDWKAVRKNGLTLILSSVFMAINWILLFEAYRYTSVATATICYYMAPILVMLGAVPMFGDTLTGRKILCVLAAFLGLIFLSGIFKTGFTGLSELKGVLFGLGAAVLYATVVLLNKKLKDITSYDRTIVQMGVAAISLLPYTLLTENVTSFSLEPLAVFMLLVVGVFHTGIAYVFYFGSLGVLKTSTVALFSYIDPVVAILLSALLLREPFGIFELLGTILVLGAAFISEREPRKD